MNLCFLARGLIDCYTAEELKPWDIVPGAILVSEAGGTISLVDGSPFDLLRGNISAACNENLHKELVELVGEADRTSLFIHITP